MTLLVRWRRAAVSAALRWMKTWLGLFGDGLEAGEEPAYWCLREDVVSVVHLLRVIGAVAVLWWHRSCLLNEMPICPPLSWSITGSRVCFRRSLSTVFTSIWCIQEFTLIYNLELTMAQLRDVSPL